MPGTEVDFTTNRCGIEESGVDYDPDYYESLTWYEGYRDGDLLDARSSHRGAVDGIPGHLLPLGL